MTGEEARGRTVEGALALAAECLQEAGTRSKAAFFDSPGHGRTTHVSMRRLPSSPPKGRLFVDIRGFRPPLSPTSSSRGSCRRSVRHRSGGSIKHGFDPTTETSPRRRDPRPMKPLPMLRKSSPC